jgi:hypothetical protein
MADNPRLLCDDTLALAIGALGIFDAAGPQVRRPLLSFKQSGRNSEVLSTRVV